MWVRLPPGALDRPTIGDSLLNMGSRWTLVLCRGLSKPSSQESRSESYGSVNDSKSGIRWGVRVRVPPEVLAPRRKRWGAYDASVVEW